MALTENVPVAVVVDVVDVTIDSCRSHDCYRTTIKLAVIAVITLVVAVVILLVLVTL